MSEPDWKFLKSARGAATAIGAYLRGLGSTDPAVRESSVTNLAADLYGNDTWYSASGPALTAIVRLASAPATPRRGVC
jgi:hypothetical protein